MNIAPIGIIGGTGLDTFPELEVIERMPLITPYGPPSADPVVGRLAGRPVVYIPRHGPEHRIPPHLVPYKANLFALRELGARTVVATCIVGSLKEDIEPGHFVVPDQFVHFTWGRDAHSVEANGDFIHLGMLEPYCVKLRGELCRGIGAQDIVRHNGGTTVVIQGPRFNTRAESQFQIKQGWDIVNMTQYPECVFARELGLCYAVMASVTDWDVGVGKTISMQPENMARVLQIFRENTCKTKQVLERLVSQLADFSCGCAANVVAEYYKHQ